MRAEILLALIGLFPVVLYAADDKPRNFPVGKDDVGRLPKNWQADKTGSGEGSVWKEIGRAHV